MTRFACSAASLRTQPFFAAFTDREIDAVLPHVQHRRYAPRTRMLCAGEVSDGLYLVLSGTAAVLHHDGDGRQFIASVVGAGELFGELGLIEGEPSSATVQSQEVCELIFLARAHVLQCVERSAGAALSLLRTVVARLHEAHRKMERLALHSVYDRVAHVLLDSGRYVDGELVVDVGAERIAATIGASREMVSRVVGEMIRKQAVRRDRRRIVVLDRRALERDRTALHPEPVPSRVPANVYRFALG
jgi:CRP/FNR family cyclic AMP-dependent transcriptional regulator